MNEQFMKEKPVFPLILSMALPMVISMLVNSLYNIVDSYFVAKISEDAMTALSLVFPIQNLISALAIGFGVGINAVISFYLGEEDPRSANIAATHGTAFALLHSILATIGSLAVIPVFLRMFTDSDSVVQLGLQYSNIVFLFSTALIMSITFEKLFQAVGRMKITMFGLLCGCLANLCLDPLLIFGFGPIPAMGIQGAALATGLGQALCLAVYLVVYKVQPLPIQIGRQYFARDAKIDFKIYAVGIPAALNLALPSLLISCLNSLLSFYSQSYVVVLGIYYKLQTFLYLPLSGIIQGIRPIVGYNFGAKEYGRVKRVYGITLCMSGAIMAVGTLICLTLSGEIISLFTSNPETIEAGQAALKIISAGFLVSAVSVTTSGALEGLGRGTQSLVISMFRYVIVIIPAAFLFCRIWGADGVWNAFWVAEMVSAVTAALVWMYVSRNCLQVQVGESVRGNL